MFLWESFVKSNTITTIKQNEFFSVQKFYIKEPQNELVTLEEIYKSENFKQ